MVEVVLDGAEGYGSSFLEEAFAGLVRKLNMSSAEFNAKVSFVATEDPSLLEEIALYIADEERRRIAAKS